MNKESKRIWGTLDPFYESGAVLGRKVANARFMDFLLKADPFDEYHFFLSSEDSRASLKTGLEHMAPHIAARGGFSLLDRRDLPHALSSRDYHCFHQSDCITSQPHIARLRNAYSREIFPITGVTHSLSYADYATHFLQHLWPGTTPRDCIVSTSSAGVSAVDHFLDGLRAQYRMDDSFGRPSVRRVPLGIDPQTYSPAPKQDGKCTILVFGRISHYSKMDLLPLFRALHRLFSDGLDKDSVRLVLGGWTDEDDTYTATLEELAGNIGLELVIHARPTEEEKTRIFHESDIFVTIADNPQETFGITVLEAGAFGLPIVASDYDGYKDTILHDETGLLVPTIGPATTLDADLMAPFSFDNHYHLALAQQTAVHVPALAESLRQLILDPERRRTMGERAREHVSEKYSWESVIEEYVALWDDLWKLPVDAHVLRDTVHPCHIRYSEVFSHYPSENIADKTVLRTGRTGEALYRGRDFPLLYGGMERLINMELVKKMVFFARKPITCAELVDRMGTVTQELTRDRADYHILWCLKHDLLEKG